MAKPEDTMTLETTKGNVVIEMRPDLAPGHVARIKELVREGFYDGIVFHRVIDGFMAQTGCPQGTGTGGSGKKLKAEFNKEPHVRGTVSMARAQDPEFRRQPVLHLLRRRDLPRQPVHRLGQGRPRAWRTSTRSSAASRCAIPTRSSRRRWRAKRSRRSDRRLSCRARSRPNAGHPLRLRRGIQYARGYWIAPGNDAEIHAHRPLRLRPPARAHRAAARRAARCGAAAGRAAGRRAGA